MRCSPEVRMTRSGVGHVSRVQSAEVMSGSSMRVLMASSTPSAASMSSTEMPRLVSFRDEIVDERAGSIDDFGAGAVVEREGEGGAGVLGSLLGRPLHGVLDFLGKLVGATDVGHADIVIVHPLNVSNEVVAQQFHQEVDFVFRTTKVVLERKGVERDPG